jgi:hypothetical protein
VYWAIGETKQFGFRVALPPRISKSDSGTNSVKLSVKATKPDARSFHIISPRPLVPPVSYICPLRPLPLRISIARRPDHQHERSIERDPNGGDGARFRVLLQRRLRLLARLRRSRRWRVLRPVVCRVLRGLHAVEPFAARGVAGLHALEHSSARRVAGLHAVEPSSARRVAGLHALEHTSPRGVPGLHAVEPSSACWVTRLHAIEPVRSRCTAWLHSIDVFLPRRVAGLHPVDSSWARRAGWLHAKYPGASAAGPGRRVTRVAVLQSVDSSRARRVAGLQAQYAASVAPGIRRAQVTTAPPPLPVPEDRRQHMLLARQPHQPREASASLLVLCIV